MGMSVANEAALRHLLPSEHDHTMAKAALRNSENGQSWAQLLGKVIDRARLACEWNLNELAQKVNRDPSQVRRWIAGQENPKWDVLWACDEDYRHALLLELARLCHRCKVTTTISIVVTGRTA